MSALTILFEPQAFWGEKVSEGAGIRQIGQTAR